MLLKAIYRRLRGSRQRPQPGSKPVQLQGHARALHREAPPFDHPKPHGYRVGRRIGQGIQNAHRVEHATQPERYGWRARISRTLPTSETQSGSIAGPLEVPQDG